MILRPRTYAALALATFLTVLGFRLGVAALFDPFADFYYLTGVRSGEFRSVEQFTERKVKRRMVEEAAADGMSLAIFGNSRAAILDPTLIDPNGANLAFSGARTEDVALFVRRFKTLHPRARAIVALDFDQCFTPSAPNPLYLDPASDDEARRDALARLLALSTIEDWIKATAMEKAMPQHLAPRGNVVRLVDSAQIETRTRIDLDLYRSFFREASFQADCVETAQAVRAVDPQALFFINPISAGMAATLDETGNRPRLEHWRHEIARLGGVLDFSCSESLRRGDFTDGHHYGPGIAARITADIAAVITGGRPAEACLLTASGP